MTTHNTGVFLSVCSSVVSKAVFLISVPVDALLHILKSPLWALKSRQGLLGKEEVEIYSCSDTQSADVPYIMLFGWYRYTRFLNG